MGGMKGRRTRRGRVRKWEEEEAKELSRLVLGFAERCGKLPRKSDNEFWEFCCARLQRRFTARQIQDKVRHLRVRVLKVSSGLPFRVRVAEREILEIWARIMLLQYPPPSLAPQTQGGDKGGVPAAAASEANAGEDEQDTSTFSTENVLPQPQYTHHEDHGAYTMHTEDDAHATPDVGGCDHNWTLLHHITVADLAAATKTLAEILHSLGPPAMA